MKFRMTLGGTAAVLFFLTPIAGPIALEAQGPDGRWPLQPRSSMNRVVAPFMEGWYENEDGTYTYSFGYLNMNSDTVYIPVGEDNFLEPTDYDGMQPNVFFPGHQRGVFAVTVPAPMRDVDIWWTLNNDNGETTRVPGRNNAIAYQLDWFPRPHGSVPPRVSFDGGDQARGPQGIVAETNLNTTVGQPVEVVITTAEISERDDEDFRFNETLPLRVVWSLHQGPDGSEIEWTRHERTPVPEVSEEEAARRERTGSTGPGAQQVMLAEEGNGDGDAYVYATFNLPGEYILLAQVDNFRAPDSSSGDQCCWTNGYVRVTVTE